MTRNYRFHFLTLGLFASGAAHISSIHLGDEPLRQPDRLDIDQFNENIVELTTRLCNTTTSKEEYLKWVSAWKFLYAAVSSDIVAVKSARDFPIFGNNVWERSRSDRQADASALRKYATTLLELRRINKVLSGINRAAFFAANPKVA